MDAVDAIYALLQQNTASSFCIIKQLGVLLVLPGWDADASHPFPPLHIY